MFQIAAHTHLMLWHISCLKLDPHCLKLIWKIEDTAFWRWRLFFYCLVGEDQKKETQREALTNLHQINKCPNIQLLRCWHLAQQLYKMTRRSAGTDASTFLNNVMWQKEVPFVYYIWLLCVYNVLCVCKQMLSSSLYSPLLKLLFLFFTIRFKSNIIAYFETTIDRSIDRGFIPRQYYEMNPVMSCSVHILYEPLFVSAIHDEIIWTEQFCLCNSLRLLKECYQSRTLTTTAAFTADRRFSPLKGKRSKWD